MVGNFFKKHPLTNPKRENKKVVQPIIIAETNILDEVSAKVTPAARASILVAIAIINKQDSDKHSGTSLSFSKAS